MNRNEIIQSADTYLIPRIKELYALNGFVISLIVGHEGGRNIVYSCDKNGEKGVMIRLSYLPDRTREDYLAELEYIRYLADNGASVANVLNSVNGKLLEELNYNGQDFFISALERAEGQQLADNGYRYRDGAPLSEYFYNCGKTLGKMHELSKHYSPVHKRYSFFEKYTNEFIDKLIPEELSELKPKLYELVKRLNAVERDNESYGMVHFDYSDGNYMIDYKTGKITVFDFDNACMFWYMYDLANLWSHGVGWIQFERDIDKRRGFMDGYFKTVLDGYKTETSISDSMLEKLPLFIQAVVMEGILDELEVRQHGDYIDDEDDEDDDGWLMYHVKCITDDILYEGFFDEIYSCDSPFVLEA